MHAAVCISQPCVKLRVTAVSSDAELWQLFDVLPAKSEDDEVGWMPAHVQRTTGSRWKHLGNLALFRLAYIRKFWGHPLVKEAYETTMWESKQAPVCLHNVPHFWNVSLVTPFQRPKRIWFWYITGTENCIASIFATDLLYCFVLRTKMQQERNPLHSKLATHIKPSQIFNEMKLNYFACSLCSTVTFCSSCKNPP